MKQWWSKFNVKQKSFILFVIWLINMGFYIGMPDTWFFVKEISLIFGVIVAYSLGAYLSGITDEMIQKDRDEVLNVTEEDIRKLADYVEAVLEDNCVCVVGTAPKIEESKELFNTVDNLFH